MSYTTVRRILFIMPRAVFDHSCFVVEHCLTTTGQRTLASQVKGWTSILGTSCMCSTPRTTSGGRPGRWPQMVKWRRSASFPARGGMLSFFMVASLPIHPSLFLVFLFSPTTIPMSLLLPAHISSTRTLHVLSRWLLTPLGWMNASCCVTHKLTQKVFLIIERNSCYSRLCTSQCTLVSHNLKTTDRLSELRWLSCYSGNFQGGGTYLAAMNSHLLKC